jgi:hypothetical protein
MKKCIAGFLVIACSLAFPAFASEGNVSHRVSGCAWFLVDLPSGFVLMEWYGGNDPDKGDEVVGKMETYGMKTIFNTTVDEEFRVWIDDFMLSKNRALEKLYENCG